MGGLFNNLFSKNANCVKSLGQFSKEALKFIEETTEKECLKDGISDKEEIYNLKKEVMQKLLRGFTPDSDKISFDIYNDFSDFE